jgi:hypothetical protein
MLTGKQNQAPMDQRIEFGKKWSQILVDLPSKLRAFRRFKSSRMSKNFGLQSRGFNQNPLDREELMKDRGWGVGGVLMRLWAQF